MTPKGVVFLLSIFLHLRLSRAQQRLVYRNACHLCNRKELVARHALGSPQLGTGLAYLKRLYSLQYKYNVPYFFDYINILSELRTITNMTIRH